ncbi:MAG: WD40 repeat-like protein [Chaenotheca gracillima]|nr:MAG: WD40 repeat-like protein [Chaenotheca gracillima]
MTPGQGGAPRVSAYHPWPISPYPTGMVKDLKPRIPPAQQMRTFPSPYNGRRQLELERLSVEHRRFFGGEDGDEVGLCSGMMDVVLYLFDGGLDYIDP